MRVLVCAEAAPLTPEFILLFCLCIFFYTRALVGHLIIV